MDLIEKIIQFIMQYGIYILPYALTLFIVNSIKGFIPEGRLRRALTLGISLLISSTSELIPNFIIGFNILPYLASSLGCWAGCGFISVTWDILLDAGIKEFIIDKFKEKITSFFK